MFVQVPLPGAAGPGSTYVNVLGGQCVKQPIVHGCRKNKLNAWPGGQCAK